MNYYIYLVFLILLSGLSLITFGLYFILSIAKVTSKQKIAFIKIGLIIIGFSPIFFAILRGFSWEVIKIAIPVGYIDQASVQTAHATSPGTDISWSCYIFVVYVICFLLLISKIAFSYFSARKLLAMSLPTVIHGQPVLLNESISSPLSFGFPTSKIYFPLNAEKKWNFREIEISLAHEKLHLKHNDSLWKLYSLIIRALLFFVPWSYFLHRKFELEMEIYCDEMTCAETNADVSEYGSLLLSMVCSQSRYLIFTNIIDSTLKRRFIAMKSKTTKRPILISILSATMLLAGATSVAATSGFTEEKTVFNIASKIYIDGKLASSPHITCLANQKASLFLTNEEHFDALKYEFVARNASMTSLNDAIQINFDVYYKSGNESMHTQPKIVISPKHEGVISFTSDSGHSYEMHVLAERE